MPARRKAAARRLPRESGVLWPSNEGHQ